MSVDQIYHQAVESLTPPDRLRLATMLLETVSPGVALDDDEAWSDQDIREYRDHCRRRSVARDDGEGARDDAQAG